MYLSTTQSEVNGTRRPAPGTLRPAPGTRRPEPPVHVDRPPEAHASPLRTVLVLLLDVEAPSSGEHTSSELSSL